MAVAKEARVVHVDRPVGDDARARARADGAARLRRRAVRHRQLGPDDARRQAGQARLLDPVVRRAAGARSSLAVRKIGAGLASQLDARARAVGDVVHLLRAVGQVARRRRARRAGRWCWRPTPASPPRSASCAGAPSRRSARARRLLWLVEDGGYFLPEAFVRGVAAVGASRCGRAPLPPVGHPERLDAGRAHRRVARAGFDSVFLVGDGLVAYAAARSALRRRRASRPSSTTRCERPRERKSAAPAPASPPAPAPPPRPRRRRACSCAARPLARASRPRCRTAQRVTFALARCERATATAPSAASSRTPATIPIARTAPSSSPPSSCAPSRASSCAAATASPR